MGEWRKYKIFCLGAYAGCKKARSRKEAVKLYVEECKERYIKDYGCAPTKDMIKDAYENTNAYEDGWLI